VPHWTRDDIPDQSGRIVLLTGGNSGLGLETALALASKGARVIATTRTMARAREVADRIAAESGSGTVEFELLDLADLASVRALAGRILERGEGVDVLVNNAGVMAAPQRRTTADGFELQLGTNHLGHFALTCLLLPALLVRPRARVVTVTSYDAGIGRIRFDDLQAERKYRPWDAYSASKLATMLFALELDRRARARSIGLVSVAAHPGVAKTNLQYAGPRLGRRTVQTAGVRAFRFLFQPAERGALPSLYAATSPDVSGGALYGPDGFSHLRGYPTRTRIPKRALDADVARRLWDVSEELTGVAFTLELDRHGASAVP
jgi:NAD(P)-dependent dehydrogenase (short-subunit alcohol dehydrogenase family)